MIFNCINLLSVFGSILNNQILMHLKNKTIVNNDGLIDAEKRNDISEI